MPLRVEFGGSAAAIRLPPFRATCSDPGWRGCLRAGPALLGASAIRKAEGLVGVTGQQALAVLNKAPSLPRSVASQEPDHVVAVLRPGPGRGGPRRGRRRGGGAGRGRRARV